MIPVAIPPRSGYGALTYCRLLVSREWTVFALLRLVAGREPRIRFETWGVDLLQATREPGADFVRASSD